MLPFLCREVLVFKTTSPETLDPITGKITNYSTLEDVMNFVVYISLHTHTHIHTHTHTHTHTHGHTHTHTHIHTHTHTDTHTHTHTIGQRQNKS